MTKNSKIYIAGHSGLVGSAIFTHLVSQGYSNLITRTHDELDLTNQELVKQFFIKEKPEYVILAAAKVGGIHANSTERASFIYQNLMIQSNVIHHSYLNSVKKLLFLGSSCIYPKNAPQPIKEEYLLTSELEYSNEPYAIAKIAGLKMCESYNMQYATNFISVQPTNLYGFNDNFDLNSSHVIPALIRKFHLAKALENNDWKTINANFKQNPIFGIDNSSSDKERLQVLNQNGITKANSETSIEIWGTGKPLRDFLWSDDLAQACVCLMNTKSLVTNTKNAHLNIGTGKEVTIKQLTEIIKDVIDFHGEIIFNSNYPDGTQRKLLDSSLIESLGWKHQTELKNGIIKLYNWYLQQHI